MSLTVFCLNGVIICYIMDTGECKYVQCVPGPWTEWSAECNDAKRTRSINAVQKTTRRLSCEGLTLTCTKSEETETRTKYCK